MAYQSPLHILEALNLSPDSIEASDIGRLRKKFMADFTLSQDITITIGNAQYSKDEIIKLLDNLAKLSQLDAHLAIFRNEELLQFCESPMDHHPNDVEKFIVEFAENAETPPEARQIVGEALLEALAGCLKQREYSSSIHWHKLIQSHLEDLKESLDEMVIHHLIDTSEMLEAVNDENYSQENIERSLLFLTQKDWVDYFNFCMVDYRELITSLVANIIDLTVRLQHTQPRFCSKVGGTSINLDVNEEAKQILVSNYNVYRKNAYYKAKIGGVYISWGWILGILIFGLRVCASCDYNITSNRGNYEYEYMKKAPNYRHSQTNSSNHDSSLKQGKIKVIEIRVKKSTRKKALNSYQNENTKARENLPLSDSNGSLKPK
jgi:hypothetical protein